MYMNTGYLDPQEEDLMDDTVALRINSCGCYRFTGREGMGTKRAGGRPDYQLLYVANGKGFFNVSGTAKSEITSGHMILYRPYEPQDYQYQAGDATEIYWVHFTGSGVESLLNEMGWEGKRILFTGSSEKYGNIFTEMIRELQLKRYGCAELLTLQLKQLFLLVCRRVMEETEDTLRIPHSIRQAVQYFNQNMADSITIDTYAKEHNMSVCWFIRLFKRYMGMSPLQYLTVIRIRRAKELLEGTDYSISEISRLTGYEDPLYFSKLFRSQTGISPRQYRKTTYSGIVE